MAINPDLDKLSKEIIDGYHHEFMCMRLGENPRPISNIKWITFDDAIRIHTNLLSSIGGSFNIASKQKIENVLNNYKMVIKNGTTDDTFSIICDCVYSLYDCVSETISGQYCATIFTLLCKINNIELKFQLGDIYDIFTSMNSYNSSDVFEKVMRQYIVIYGEY